MNSGLVEEDLNRLYNAGEGKVGTNEDTFIEILTERSYDHLRALFKRYNAVSLHSCSKFIQKLDSCNNRTKQVLLTVKPGFTDAVRFGSFV